MKIKLLRKENFKKLPERQHSMDAGADVYINERVVIPAHTTVAIPLGYGLEIPNGYMAMVIPRSGCAKKGIITQIPPIDAGYTGNIHAITSNLTNEDYIIKEGDRIGQLVIIPVIIADFVDDMGEERGDNKFNSTGE